MNKYNIPPPYVDTECKDCKTKEVALFARYPQRDDKDYYCKGCMDAGKHLD